MVRCMITVRGRLVEELTLPEVPRRGELVSNVNPKQPTYLVNRVEMFPNSETVTLHVQEFPNQIAAVIAIDGFRNDRGWN